MGKDGIMTFDRFSDEPMIGDYKDYGDGGAYKECKQCGELFAIDCHSSIDEEFCNEGCAILYWG